MSHNSSPENRVPKLDAYSTAALLALRSRFRSGDDTTFDHFLFDHVGDPLTPDAPHLEWTGPAGEKYTYNSPHTITHGFTPEGTMITIRHLDDTTPDSPAPRYFVATADLRTDATTEWHVTGLMRTVNGGIERRVITLSERADMAAVQEPDSDDLLDVVLEGRLRVRQPVGRLVIDAGMGIIFTPPGGAAEAVHPITDLINEVHALETSVRLQSFGYEDDRLVAGF